MFHIFFNYFSVVAIFCLGDISLHVLGDSRDSANFSGSPGNTTVIGIENGGFLSRYCCEFIA